MNQNKDDYIKRIYHLGGKDDYITNKNLANELGLSPASVSEMIVRLEKDGYLEYIKYKGVKLTEAGRLHALFLIRAHRLWETFLSTELKYHWSEIHDDAELLEHASSKRLIDHLDEYLGFPKYCPHGTPIPSRDGVMEEIEVMSLDDVILNQRVEIIQVTQDKEILSILERHHIKLNDRIKVIEHSEVRDTLLLQNENMEEVEIGIKIAKNIFVKGE